MKQRKLNIGQRIECAFGENAREVYFSIKRAYEFIIKQAPKINKFIKIIRKNKISLVHTHSELIHGKPEIIAAKIIGSTMYLPYSCLLYTNSF